MHSSRYWQCCHVAGRRLATDRLRPVRSLGRADSRIKATRSFRQPGHHSPSLGPHCLYPVVFDPLQRSPLCLDGYVCASSIPTALECGQSSKVLQCRMLYWGYACLLDAGHPKPPRNRHHSASSYFCSRSSLSERRASFGLGVSELDPAHDQGSAEQCGRPPLDKIWRPSGIG